MLRFINKKIMNKTWLTFCLTLGISILVAIVICQPMFKKGSLDKLLQNKFDNYIEENDEYPTIIGRSGSCTTDECDDAGSVEQIISSKQNGWMNYLLGVDIDAIQTRLKFEQQSAVTGHGIKGNYLSIGYMPELQDHISIVDGVDLEQYEGEGVPCIISEAIMDEYELVVGETLEFLNWKDSKGNTIKIVVAGIYKEKSDTDIFWHIAPSKFEKEVLVSEEAFSGIMSAGTDLKKVYYDTYVMLDYYDITSNNIDDIIYYVKQFCEIDENFLTNMNTIFDEYEAEEKTIGIILWVLELPVLGMVLAFIYMVSKQIIEIEKNEIAMLKSRGISRFQVIVIYFIQSTILAFISLIFGTLVGVGLCKMVGGTTNFLSFSFENTSQYVFEPKMILYGLVAALVGVVFILIPVVVNSGITIVEHKSKKRASDKPIWEKFFLDVVILALSLYFLYNFNKTKDSIRLDAIKGSKMDPMIFIDSTFFIIGAGLVILRLVHYLVKLIYAIGKRKWRPETYASFLQINRNFSRMSSISLFMILTIALGLFNANVARTINQNNVERIKYEDGTDCILQENWIMKVYFSTKNGTRQIEYTYDEPDYGRFSSLQGNECSNLTKVIRDNNVEVTMGGRDITNCQLMGINTFEFGNTAKLNDELNTDMHWYNYLNTLGDDAGNVVISRNLAEELGIEIGDEISLTRFYVILARADDSTGEMKGKVCAIVDAWPGYDQYYYEDSEQKENYLVVANYSQVINTFGVTPYEVWMDLEDGVNPETVINDFENKGVDFNCTVSADDDIVSMKQSPLVQITNSMFTLSFIIALVLCSMGFLIYWITSIKKRELLFGVYRAMGMSMRAVIKMLINEHIFSTLLSVLSGGIVGMISTVLFAKLFGIVYLPEKHNLDIYIYYEPMDIIKLGVVVVLMILTCLVILKRLIKKMNISQALKLGEE